MSKDLQQLAAVLKLEFQGNPETRIDAVASLASAGRGDLCFIQQRKYLGALAASGCGAVILPPDLAAEVPDRAKLLSENPQFHFVQAIHALELQDAMPMPGIHASAQVADSASIGQNVSIGALAVIGEDVEIGDNCSIGAASVIEKSTSIGRSSHLHSRVVLGAGTRLGERCILHSGVVIGADGFGLALHQQRWHKIPQLGNVVIGDEVEIGANTTVDRGALDNTVIEQGCKLDNQIQVAHNVRIGAHTAIAACVGIAGSANIGRYCKISGAAVVLGHLSIADHVTVTAMSLVTKDIKQAGVYSSGTPLMENKLWHRANARYKALDELAQRIAKIEKTGSQ